MSSLGGSLGLDSKFQRKLLTDAKELRVKLLTDAVPKLAPDPVAAPRIMLRNSIRQLSRD